MPDELNQPVDPKVAIDPTLQARQESEEAVVVEPVAVVAAAEVVDVDFPEETTLKQLQEILTAEGFENAELFNTKKQVITIIKKLRTNKIATSIVASITNPGTASTVTQNIETPTEKHNWESKRDRTKAIIESAPKIRTMIPLDIGEKMGAVAELQINGYKKIIPKGVYVDLPLPFADLVAYAYNQTAEAGKDFLLDRPGVDPETGKTVAQVLG